ncbi:MAG: dihydrodipicolinate synthase family protein [Methylobacteriaceae bacterium]|nr:dihydrodipicolinate synthase family protein [Methylobacteriaceae bacterium]
MTASTTFSVPGGVWPMLYAFFDERGRIDEAAMRRQARAALANGAHGVAVLGLATEVSKLSAAERGAIRDVVADEIGGRLPLAVTIAEAQVEDAMRVAREAEAAGAAFVILQPPPTPGLSDEAQIAFYGAVADRLSIPVAVQNAPDYLKTSLSLAGLARLSARHPNVSVVKAEGSALFVQALGEATQGAMAIFNGRCGLELTDNLRAGAHGMIPGIDMIDVQARVYDLMRSGAPADEAEAERLYASILPLIVFLIQSIDNLLCYGKRVAARRLDLGPVHDRAPAQAPHPAGLAWAERLSARLGPLAH